MFTKLMSVAKQTVTFLVVSLGYCTYGNAETVNSKFCNELKQLMNQAQDQFISMQSNSEHSSQAPEAQFGLDEVDQCRFVRGIKSNSYQCAWKFDYGSPSADQFLTKLRNETLHCIGDLYPEKVDDSVNHPDFYLAYFYEFPYGQVNVSLKNKAVTMNTYVSIRVDGAK